jgi:hypothetical protein
MELHRKWQQVREMEARKMLISQATVRGLLAGDSSTVIDVEYSEQQAIAPSNEVIASLPASKPPTDLDRRKRMRERIVDLSNELQSLTGHIEVIPDLSFMSDKDMEEYGIRLRAEVNNVKEVISQSQVQ